MTQGNKGNGTQPQQPDNQPQEGEDNGSVQNPDN